MSRNITIPDLRFEESFKAKLIKNAVEENKKKGIQPEIDETNHLTTPIPKIMLIKSLIIDQIILPFLQSFFLAGVLYYLRPFIRISSRKGYSAGVSLISSIKQITKSLFFLKSKK
ncbi:hypothetical protein C6P40_002690 [Pichia californica]|uniref:Uncharacterized protein n=1 Tax=Pichia californica TaxID=460514 RepID=A0A9P6WQ84_9ASCO|nr:hypothetical protein C6P42_001669 [[Candida] californica]KAG0691299.1 hypothetical protein C6P40_002690 [[Candida] californica]